MHNALPAAGSSTFGAAAFALPTDSLAHFRPEGAAPRFRWVVAHAGAFAIPLGAFEAKTVDPELDEFVPFLSIATPMPLSAKISDRPVTTFSRCMLLWRERATIAPSEDAEATSALSRRPESSGRSGPPAVDDIAQLPNE
jgi:hypothetical protein